MTEQVTIDLEVGTTDGKPSIGKRILRFAVLIGVSVGLGIGMANGIAYWQERHRVQDLMARMEEGRDPFSAENPPGPDNFSPVQVVPPYPPITEFPVSTVEEAETAEKKLDDDELVLGVVVNNEARAYPINMLTGPTREILNDTLGGRKIAATW